MRFDQTYDLIVAGKKTETTRQPGQKWFDWYKDHPRLKKIVQAEGPHGESCPILITDVAKMQLGEIIISEEHYTREGFATGDEMIRVWERLYPHQRFDPFLEVCSIRFLRAEATGVKVI